MSGCVAQGGPIAADEAVDQQRPGQLRGRNDREVDAAERRRNDAEDGIEDEDQHQREPEVRQGAGDQAVIVGQLAQETAPAAGTCDAERDADRHGQQERQRHQLQRRREALRQVRRDRHGRLPGSAEVALQHPPQINAELLDGRAVEPELGAQPRQPLVGRERAEHHDGRVARNELQQQEADQQDAEQLRPHEKQPPSDIGEDPHQACPAATGAGPVSRCSCPARRLRCTGSASTSTLEPISAKPKMVIASASPGKIDGHQCPVMMFW